MQTAPDLTERWCAEHSLSVNPPKTQMVLFTKKRKLRALRAPVLPDTQLIFSEAAKHLDVILDSKLNAVSA